MLTILWTLVLLCFAFWLVVLGGGWALVAVGETGAIVGRGLTWCARVCAPMLALEYTIPLVLGVGPLVLLAVALLR